MNTLKKMLNPHKGEHDDHKEHSHHALHTDATSATSTRTETTVAAPAATAVTDTTIESVPARDSTHTRDTAVVEERVLETAPAKAARAEVLPEIVERQENPALVKERISRVEKEEIQPVIEREREVAEIKPIIRPVSETVNAPVRDVVKELPEEHRHYTGTMSEEETRKLHDFEAQVGTSTTQVEPTLREGAVVNEAVVHEVIRPHIIEQIQPVIERNVHEETHIHTTKPIKETIVEAPKVAEVTVEPTLTKEEFEKRYGSVSVTEPVATSTTTTATTTAAVVPEHRVVGEKVVERRLENDLTGPTTASVPGQTMVDPFTSRDPMAERAAVEKDL